MRWLLTDKTITGVDDQEPLAGGFLISRLLAEIGL